MKINKMEKTMDIKLSKRMQAVADMVDETSVVDIGCDHAFVSIYLAREAGVEKVVAMDVKKGPVNIAKSNVNSYGLSHAIDVRMSDGFQNLIVGEADQAIIAGMGGYLMIDILKKGKAHTDNGIKLILQPQSDIKAVREYLMEIGYVIEAEEMLIDDHKFYSIIKASPSNNKIYYSEEQLTFGPKLLADKNRVLDLYLHKSYKKNIDLVRKLQNTGSDRSIHRIDQITEENETIKNVLEEYFGESI